MNSDEERKLFAEYGWLYDYVAREWRAPDGTIIPLDSLVANTVEYGVIAENSLRNLIVQHGKKSEPR